MPTIAGEVVRLRHFDWLTSCPRLAHQTIWAFIAPVLLIIAFNTYVFVRIMRAVMEMRQRKNSRRAREDATSMSKLKRGLRASLSFLCLLGVTWVFGVCCDDQCVILKLCPCRRPCNWRCSRGVLVPLQHPEQSSGAGHLHFPSGARHQVCSGYDSIRRCAHGCLRVRKRLAPIFDPLSASSKKRTSATGTSGRNRPRGDKLLLRKDKDPAILARGSAVSLTSQLTADEAEALPYLGELVDQVSQWAPDESRGEVFQFDMAQQQADIDAFFISPGPLVFPEQDQDEAESTMHDQFSSSARTPEPPRRVWRDNFLGGLMSAVGSNAQDQVFNSGDELLVDVNKAHGPMVEPLPTPQPYIFHNFDADADAPQNDVKPEEPIAFEPNGDSGFSTAGSVEAARSAQAKQSDTTAAAGLEFASVVEALQKVADANSMSSTP